MPSLRAFGFSFIVFDLWQGGVSAQRNRKRKKKTPIPITKKYMAINVSQIWVEVKVLAGFPVVVYHVYVCSYVDMHAWMCAGTSNRNQEQTDFEPIFAAGPFKNLSEL